LLISIVVSLFPLAFYLFYLAGLNRRERPTLVHGLWESAALLFSLSGFLLYTFPSLLKELFQRDATIPLQDSSFDEIWLKWSVIWGCYYFGLMLMTLGMLLSRRNVRGVYNVDLVQFREVLFQTVAEKRLTPRAQGNVLFIFEGEKLEGTEISATPRLAHEPRLLGELKIDVFAPLCHVTLRWLHGEPAFVADFERALENNLENAVAADNPAANWFLGIASLLFGALFMLGAMWVFGQFFPRQH
jgi:hypothetical protein